MNKLSSLVGLRCRRFLLKAAPALLVSAAVLALAVHGAHSEPPASPFVSVKATGCGGRSLSVGFAVTPELLVTTAHPVAGRQWIVVTDSEGHLLNGFVVGVDPVRDIAAIRVPGLSAVPATLAAQDVPPPAPASSRGVVAAVRPDGFLLEKPYEVLRLVRAHVDDIYFTSRSPRQALNLKFAGTEGDSGAAVVNESGKVVGMLFAMSQDRMGTGYATRSVEILDFLDEDDLLAEEDLLPLQTDCP